MKHLTCAGWINSLVGSLSVVVYLVMVTGGQFYLQSHFSPPWREVLLLASVPLEYVGLAYWSAWINRWVDAPALTEQFTQPVAPVVLASRGAPTEQAVGEILRLADELHRPVLLVSLASLAEADTSFWIERVWQSLAAHGLQVSAQAMVTPEPERAVDEIIGATGAVHVVWGQLDHADQLSGW